MKWLKHRRWLRANRPSALVRAKDRETRRVVIGCVGATALALLVWWGFSVFEAAAYENATGHHVSTWDAMFLDLRVQAVPKESPK